MFQTTFITLNFVIFFLFNMAALSSQAENIDFPAIRILSCTFKKFVDPKDPSPHLQSEAPQIINFFVDENSLLEFVQSEPNAEVSGFTVVQRDTPDKGQEPQIAVPFKMTFTAHRSLLGMIDKKFHDQVFRINIENPTAARFLMADGNTELNAILQDTQKDTTMEIEYSCKVSSF